MPTKKETKKETKKDPILDDELITEVPVEEEVKSSEPIGNQLPLSSKAKQMKQKLASEPKEMVFVPLAPGEKLGVTQSVVLNGYPMFIPKGKYIEVPQTVKEVLENKLKVQLAVQSHPSKISDEGQVALTKYGA